MGNSDFGEERLEKMIREAFDNDHYLQMQSEHIRQRIAAFGGKLYL